MDNINYTVINMVSKHQNGEISFDNLVNALSEDET